MKWVGWLVPVYCYQWHTCNVAKMNLLKHWSIEWRREDITRTKGQPRPKNWSSNFVPHSYCMIDFLLKKKKIRIFVCIQSLRNSSKIALIFNVETCVQIENYSWKINHWKCVQQLELFSRNRCNKDQKRKMNDPNSFTYFNSASNVR